MRKTVLLAGLTVAVVISSAGCRSGAVVHRSASAPTTSPAATTPVATAAAGVGEGGAGTITLAVTDPVQASGHAGTSVTCATGRSYVASATSVAIDGHTLSFTVRATRYHGAGTYPALVTLRLDSPSGAVTSVSGVPNIRADLADTSGAFTIDATGANGRTLAATLKWRCG